MMSLKVIWRGCSTEFARLLISFMSFMISTAPMIRPSLLVIGLQVTKNCRRPVLVMMSFLRFRKLLPERHSRMV